MLLLPSNHPCCTLTPVIYYKNPSLVEAVRVLGCNGAATVIQARRGWWRWIQKEPGGVPKMETIPELRWMVGVPKIGVCLR